MKGTDWQRRNRRGMALASLPLLVVWWVFCAVYWFFAGALVIGAFASNPIIGIIVLLFAVGLFRKVQYP